MERRDASRGDGWVMGTRHGEMDGSWGRVTGRWMGHGDASRGRRNSLLWAGAHGLGHLVFLVDRDVLADRRGVPVDLIELEHLRGDHVAERVTLAFLRVDVNLHSRLLWL